ncbi:MAG: mRNA binding protein puf3 [Bogoriella megaspora]|nr:MAG: mRNA binding protein puf3 [Bogoriella megaspora]
MTSGLVSRQGLSLQTSSQGRFSELSGQPVKSASDSTRTPQGTLGTGFSTMNKSYGGNIWGNGTFGTGFGSSTRDSSRTREGSAFLGARPDETQGKTGSGALVSTSESDDWQGPSWGNRDTHKSSRSTSEVRNDGVSPINQRSNNGVTSSQVFRDTSPFAPGQMPSAVGQGIQPRNAFESNAMGFKANRTASSFSGGFAGNQAPYIDTDVRRGIETSGSWADAAVFQSPPDDQSSVHGSDYLGIGLPPSQHSSLPPSRQGHETASFSSYDHQPFRSREPLSNSAQFRGHVPSLSSQTNGGAYSERSLSQENDLNAHLRRLSLQHPDQPLGALKPSLSINGAPAHISHPGQDFANRQPFSDFSQQLPVRNGNAIGQQRSFTPNRGPNVRGMYSENPGSTVHGEVRAKYTGSYVSAESTPPRAYVPSGPANGDSRATNNHIAMLESRLRGLQQEQQRFPSHLPQMMAAQYQIPYGHAYSYGHPQPLAAVNGMTPYMQMQPAHNMMPVMEHQRNLQEHEQGQSIRSALLDEFKASQKTSRRYELKVKWSDDLMNATANNFKDIYDHIVEFGGDQYGSRFIQQKLETANSDEKERVFREIQSNSLQLMSDVFGNYVIQKFFEHGDQTQKRFLANKMKGQIFALSTQTYACRVVQKALEHVLTDQQASMVRELEPRAVECVKDQNGNHVIQKAIERVPPEHMRFIVSALIGKVQDLSIHPYGCRVIQRMLEFCELPIKRKVLQEIQTCEATLVPDQYGNYVTQHAIALGSVEDRCRFFELVKTNLITYSRHKYASNVVEKVLLHGTSDQRREIMMTVTGKNKQGESNLVTMIKDGYANYVIQKLLDTLDKPDYLAFVEKLQPKLLEAKHTAPSKNVQAVENKMHRLEIQTPYGVHTLTPPCISTNISNTNTPPPPLTGSGQSPQSSSLPSTNTSTVDEPVQGGLVVKPSTVHEVSIAT